MTDLRSICGLPIKIDLEKNEIYYDESIVFEEQRDVPIEDITPVLLNKFLKYPERVYRHYVNVSYVTDEEIRKNKVSYDVIKIPQGLLGIEYVKTHIYHSEYEEGKFDCMVEVIIGELTVFIQKNAEIDEFEYTPTTPVDEIKIIKLAKGDKLAIPTGVFYTFVNTGSTVVVFAKVSSKNHTPVDYRVFQREKGLAFYIISKNARLEIVANPKYKVSQPAERINWKNVAEEIRSKFISDTLIEKRDPLYNILKDDAKAIEKCLRCA